MSNPYDLRDYAYPCMMAEKALRAVHEAMLRNDYTAARDRSIVALVECSRMLDAIEWGKESGHAVRQQN